MAPASAMTAPSLEAYAVQSAPSFAGLQKKTRKFNYALANGVTEISDLPRGDLINRILFLGADIDHITKVQLSVDNFIAWETDQSYLQALAGSYQFRDPDQVAGVNEVWPVDFSISGYGDQMVQTAGVSDLRLIITTNAAIGSQAILVEYVGPLAT